jgi:hypothetical protein
MVDLAATRARATANLCSGKPEHGSGGHAHGHVTHALYGWGGQVAPLAGGNHHHRHHTVGGVCRMAPDL